MTDDQPTPQIDADVAARGDAASGRAVADGPSADRGGDQRGCCPALEGTNGDNEGGGEQRQVEPFYLIGALTPCPASSASFHPLEPSPCDASRLPAF